MELYQVKTTIVNFTDALLSKNVTDDNLLNKAWMWKKQFKEIKSFEW